MKKEPITLLDIFNEMGEMYSNLWNKMEDMQAKLNKLTENKGNK